MKDVVLVADNLRSCHNVGSLLRTAEGLGINEVWLTGYTPYPLQPEDKRLPHLAQKITNKIKKTSLGAEDLVRVNHSADITQPIKDLKARGYQVWALEQTKMALPLVNVKSVSKLVLIVGNEVTGIKPKVLKLCDKTVEIPMLGRKESFNVVQAAAMALYHLRAMD